MPYDYRKHGYTTLPEHMPEKHLKHNETLGWDAEYFLSLATKIGESAVAVFNVLLTFTAVAIALILYFSS